MKKTTLEVYPATTPMFPEFGLPQQHGIDEYFELSTGAQVEIQDDVAFPPDDVSEFIVFSEPNQDIESLSLQWSENPPMHPGIQDRLLPCLQDLLEFPSSNLGDGNFESNEMIHFDGSEFDVPSVLEDVGMQPIAEFSGREEEVGGTSEMESSVYFVNSMDDQLPFTNEEIRSLRFVSRVVTPNPYNSEDGDVESENQSDMDLLEGTGKHGLVEVERSAEEVQASSCFEKIGHRKKRRIRFLKGWNTIQSKLKLIHSRTGATCNLEATLDSERFTMPKQKRFRNDSITRSSDVGDDNISDGSETDNDHRYAAVILTQKLSSRNVMDHQYNEIPSRTAETEEVSSSPSSISRFLNTRYIRERQLVSFLLSVFNKIQKLKVLTGATVLLNIAYEDHVFTENNFREADALLSNRRKKLCRVSTAAHVTTSGNDSSSVENSNSLFTVSVEKLPGEEDERPNMCIRFVIKDKNVSEELPSLMPIADNFGKARLDDSLSCTAATKSGTQCMSISSSSPPSPPCFQQIRRPIDNIGIPDHCYGVMDLSERDEDCGYSATETMTTGSISPFEANWGSPLSISSTVSTQSARIHVEDPQSSDRPRDAETNTYPSCGVCSSTFPPSTSSALHPAENLWIRCFDSFCQTMVHPVCIGFRVTSSASLKMLPPYFCENHRQD